MTALIVIIIVRVMEGAPIDAKYSSSLMINQKPAEASNAQNTPTKANNTTKMITTFGLPFPMSFLYQL